jgi:hypothetical protein
MDDPPGPSPDLQPAAGVAEPTEQRICDLLATLDTLL